MTVTNVPQVEGLTWERWAAELTFQDATIPYPPPEEEWRTWARFVLAYTPLAVVTPPDPRYFNDWREWATRFRETYAAGA